MPEYVKGAPGIVAAPDDGLPCDRCPILNLGEKYPEHDPRDPWRRMPRLFLKAQALFGRSMYSHGGKSRLELEKRLGHYCRVMRERHGPCATPRLRLCATRLGEVLDSARADAPKPPDRRRYAYARITRLANDDDHHELMKATRVAPATVGIRVPPISLEDIPDA